MNMKFGIVIMLLLGVHLGMAMDKLEVLVKQSGLQRVLIERDVTLSSDMTLPSDIELEFRGRGRISAVGDVRLVVQGSVQAPTMEIFSGFKPGRIVLSSKKNPHCYPQWFGAKADGNHNDSPALQCAIQCGVGKIILSKGSFLLNESLNITNMPSGITIEGSGHGDGATVLVGNSGDVVLDASGSRYTYFKNFRIISGKGNPSTIGILYARTKEVPFVEFNSIADLAIKLDSNLKANHGHGTIAVYNYAAELWRGHNIYLIADNAIVFTGYNILKVDSPFRKIGVYSSMSVCSITGSSTLSGLSGPCVLLDNAFSIDIQNVYFTGRIVPEVEDSEYAIITKGGCFQQDLHVTGHLETKRSWFKNNVILTGLKLIGSSAPAYPAAIVNNGSIQNAVIDLKTWIDVPDKNSVLLKSLKGSIRNSDIILGNCQSIDAPTTHFTGNTVRSGLNAKQIIKRILVDRNHCSFMLYSADDIFPITSKNASQLPTVLPADYYFPNPLKKKSSSAMPKSASSVAAKASPTTGNVADVRENLGNLSDGARLSILANTSVRCSPFYQFTEVPAKLVGLPCITMKRGEGKNPDASRYSFDLKAPATLYLVTYRCPAPEGWEKTEMSAKWKNYNKIMTDPIYKKTVLAGRVEIPLPRFDRKPLFIIPHAVIVDFNAQP